MCSSPPKELHAPASAARIERRGLLNAELAAHEMGKVTLEEALQLVVLYTENRLTRGPSGRWRAGSAASSPRNEWSLRSRLSVSSSSRR